MVVNNALPRARNLLCKLLETQISQRNVTDHNQIIATYLNYNEVLGDNARLVCFLTKKMVLLPLSKLIARHNFDDDAALGGLSVQRKGADVQHVQVEMP